MKGASQIEFYKNGVAIELSEFTGEINKELSHLRDAERRLAELVEAVTPSASTKMAYMGEFSFFETYFNEEGEEERQEVTVPWTTIKEIMKAIRARAAVGALVEGSE